MTRTSAIILLSASELGWIALIGVAAAFDQQHARSALEVTAHAAREAEMGKQLDEARAALDASDARSAAREDRVRRLQRELEAWRDTTGMADPQAAAAALEAARRARDVAASERDALQSRIAALRQRIHDGAADRQREAGLSKDLADQRAANAQLQRQLRYLQLQKPAIHADLLGIRGSLQRTVIIFDSSQSMRRSGRWDGALATLRTWIRHLAVERAALLSFATRVRACPADGYLSLVGPDADARRDAMVTWLARIGPDGQGTDTLAALRRAIAYRPTAIILFTDGAPRREIQLSRYSGRLMAQIVAYLGEQVAAGRCPPVNVVALGEFFDPQVGSFLMAVARETGGTFHGR